MAQKPKVLIVDDDNEIVRGASIRLRAAGYDVIAAHDGEAGYNAALQHHPDAIILDLRMPVMDGWTMLATLHKHEETKAIPAVVLSANVVDREGGKAMDLGASCFLEKPYEAKRLVKAIEFVMGESAKKRSNQAGSKREMHH
ncbi:MAG: response regulator [Phycisphaerales bacterium]|nr:response regulator [Phycisphaerales bacterium]